MIKRYFYFSGLFLCIGFIHAQSNTIDSLNQTVPELVEIEPVEEDQNVLPYTLDNNPEVKPKKFKKDFKKQYLSSEKFDYDKNIQPDGFWQRFKRWVNSLVERFFRQFSIDYHTANRIEIFYRISGIVAILGLLYYIIRAYLEKDLYWLTKKKGKQVKIDISDIEQNLENINFPALINQTIAEKQYRLTIRYYYLWLLQQLQQQNHIVWHAEKTNSDYVNEIKDTAIKTNFRYLSYIYNNIWYGEHQIEENEFISAKQSFESILKPVNNQQS
ncbi:DUF4129 domain-containing protein [Myroides indicus]|uniref:DUF4129 domain-containing protein n=1 Tax=Myroides indicus TaxID=1323422 RepID=A0A4R7F155_9FLAO|nr:DUF4129 domain-containing protein [Myroides indicus]TDS56893.1 hypothetical protein C8P70_11842 [Myroides indicus]